MTIKDARAAALLIQQELIDLDVDADVTLSKLWLSEALQPTAIMVTVSLENRTTSSCFYIDETGSIWGNNDRWGSVFAPVPNRNWDFSDIPTKVASELPALLSFKASAEARLGSLAAIVKKRSSK